MKTPITIKHGLDIPLKGYPFGDLKEIQDYQTICLNLSGSEASFFRPLVSVGDHIKQGEKILFNKKLKNIFYSSPATGSIQEIFFDPKEKQLKIIISCNKNNTEEHLILPSFNLENASFEEIVSFFSNSGLLPHIKERPFNNLCNGIKKPRKIFIKAIESLPFVPSAEQQLQGHEQAFEKGLLVLNTICPNNTHLIHHYSSSCPLFINQASVISHPAKGKHPISCPSLHIFKISPIQGVSDCVWTLSVIDVITIGYRFLNGSYFVNRIIGVGGDRLAENNRGFYNGRIGIPISAILTNQDTPHIVISGDPLTGCLSSLNEFLNFYHTTISVVFKETTQKTLPFIKPGLNLYSATKTFLSSLLLKLKIKKTFLFNNLLNGEQRFLIDSEIYDKIMPLPIPTVSLIKAILSNDLNQANNLGLLHLASEDFALASFICPSKTDFIDIINQALHNLQEQHL